MSQPNRSNKSPAPKRKRGRKLLLALGLLLVLLVVGVLALPTIAGAVAPGIIAGKAGESIAGRVEVDAVSLSWTGAQRVRGVRLYDPDNVLVAELDVSAGAGLLGLATGSRDLGEIGLSGVIKADRNDAGEPRFMNAIASTKAPGAKGGGTAGAGSGKPASVPSSLAAKLNITQLRVEDGSDVLATLTGTASLAPGAPIKANLKPTFAGGGSGVLDATITSLIDSAGVIDVGGASVALTLDLSDVPASLVQAFNPSDTDLPAILGEAFSLDASANGTLETMDASTSIRSAGVNGGVALNIRDGVLTRTGESQIRVSGERAARAIPALRRALAESASIEFETWPEATLVVSQLRAPMDAVRAGTYEGVLVELRVESTPSRARVPLSGDASRTGVLDLSEIVIFSSSEDLSKGIGILVAASAELDGQPAGDIVVENLRTGPLFDASGALRDPMSIGITGEVRVTGLAAETVQPFVDAMGVRIAQEFGPTLNATLKASSGESSEAIDLHFMVDGAQFEAGFHVLLEGTRVSTPERVQAATATMRNPGATLNRLLSGSGGITIDRASPISLRVETLSVDLGAFSGGTPDLRTVRAQGVLRANSISGSLEREGEVTPISITGLELSIDAPQSLANITGKGVMQLASGSNPPAAVTADLRASDLLGGEGQIDIWGATLAASVMAPSIPAGAINAFLPADTIDAARDMGPSVSLSANIHKASGRGEPALLDLKLDSERLNITGALAADKSSVRTREGGIEVNAQGLAGLIERFASLPQGASVNPEAKGTLQVTSLSVPLTEGVPALEGATFDVGARVTQLGVRSDQGTKPRANARPIELTLSRKAGQDAQFRVATEGVTLKGLPMGADPETGALREAPTSVLAISAEGSAPWAALVGEGGADVKINLTGSLSDEAGQQLAGLSGGGSVRAPSMSRVDLNVATQLTSSARTQEALALDDLLTGLFGQTATLRASLASDAFDPKSPLKGSRIGLEVDSPRMKTSAPLRLVGDDASLRLEKASKLTWRVAPEWATKRLAGPGEPAFRVTRAVDLTLDMQRLVLPHSGAGSPDVQIGATSSDVSLTMADGTQIEYQGLVATASSTQTPGTLAINATMKNKGGGDDALSAELTLEGIGQEGQQPAASGLIVITALPSSVADAIAGGNGKLAMLLGETADVRARVENFPREGGTAKGSVKGPNAAATFEGRVTNGMFVGTKPTSLNVRRVDSEFGFELAKVIPIFGGITKEEGTHAPARVVINPMRIPVDGRSVLEFASATINIDPGEANLQLDGGMGKFLRLGGQGQTIGQRLQPFDVQYQNGVATYDNLTVPIGEFNLVSKGSVNLVEQTQNVRVNLPIGALASEFAGGTGVLGQVLDATGGVSLASVGSIGKSGWELKLGGGGGGGNAPDPGKLLEGILGGRKKGGG